MANISLRRSIAWLPDPPSEPTSTIVLTSPQHRFVDVRIILPPGSGAVSMPDGSIRFDAAGEPGVPEEPETRLALEWAFAGTSSSVPLDTADTAAAPATRGQWRHWVDSQHDTTETSVVDEGVCVTQADGTMLETGAMENPATGRVTPYEEVWQSLAPLAPDANDAPPRRPRCLVLQLQDDAGGRRGVVEVLGRFCQGVVRTTEDGVTAERWHWEAPAGAAPGTPPGWQRVFRYGRGSLPCEAAAQKAADLREGDNVLSGAVAWTVIEAADL